MSDRKDREELERDRMKVDSGYRESAYGRVQLTGSAYSSLPDVERTPDADDIVDALFLRASATEAGDRKTAHLMRAAGAMIRMMEDRIEALQRRLEARKEGTDDSAGDRGGSQVAR
jgi:hypothetical protein